MKVLLLLPLALDAMAIERQESTGEQGRFKVVARMVMAMQRFKGEAAAGGWRVSVDSAG